MAQVYDSIEAYHRHQRQKRAQQAQQAERWEQHRQRMQRMWDGPATKPARPRSAGEALYSSSKAKLLTDAKRGGVSPLGTNASPSSWWSRDLSRSQVMKGRK
jgi:hypothetical protein